MSFEVAHFEIDELDATENVEKLKPEAQAKELARVSPSLALQASISITFHEVACEMRNFKTDASGDME